MFSNKQVIELGAGCGLAGFVSANYSAHSVITDGNDIVMKLLNQNKDHLSSSLNNVSVKKLMWGVKENVEQLFDSESGDESKYPEVIIGADVILWPNMVLGLLYTIRWLLTYKPKQSQCYISYIVRATATTDLLHLTAGKLGLVIADIPVSSFLPAEVHFLDSTEKHLFSISIDESKPFDPNSEEILEYSRQIESQYAPC